MRKLDSLWQAIVDAAKLVLRNPALLKLTLRLAYEVFSYFEKHDAK